MATFVLVHGLHHGGWCWKLVAGLLRAAGHDVYAPTLTGLGERAHLASPAVGVGTHVQDVVNVLAYEDLDGVLLVGHSYAGMVITGVADRVPARIAHLVYLDAAVPEDGECLLDFFAPDRRAALLEGMRAHGQGWLLPVGESRYGIADEADWRWVRSKLVPHPAKSVTEPLRLARPAGAGRPATYVACPADRAPGSSAAQLYAPFVARARGHGWPYHELPTGHDVMVTAPRELVDLLLRLA